MDRTRTASPVSSMTRLSASAVLSSCIFRRVSTASEKVVLSWSQRSVRPSLYRLAMDWKPRTARTSRAPVPCSRRSKVSDGGRLSRPSCRSQQKSRRVGAAGNPQAARLGNPAARRRGARAAALRPRARKRWSAGLRKARPRRWGSTRRGAGSGLKTPPTAHSRTSPLRARKGCLQSRNCSSSASRWVRTGRRMAMS